MDDSGDASASRRGSKSPGDGSRHGSKSPGGDASRRGSKSPGFASDDDSRGCTKETDLAAGLRHGLGLAPEALFEQQVDAKSAGYQAFLDRPRLWQRRLIQRPWKLPIIAMHLAAVALQRAWRRNWLCQTKPSSAVGKARSFPIVKPPPSPRDRKGRAMPSDPRVQEALRQRFFDILRNRCDEAALYAAGNNVAVLHAAAPYPTFDHFCAAMIQGRWRSHCKLRIARRVQGFQQLKLYHVAAFEIQRAWGAMVKRRLDAHLNGEEYAVEVAQHKRAQLCDAAARKLQKAWRSTINFRIYESLRDTIRNFQRSGDPFLLMRSVLPREAMLLDPAMQAHVRFRLGGARFPPSIYYKIYTHGAICDLGSFAPRNYAAERIIGLDLPDKHGWYEREENNGWRPIAIRLSPGVERLRDEVERASDRKVVKDFHFSRLRRRQDQEKKRKKRNLEWMQKLYGMLPSASDAPIVEHEMMSENQFVAETFEARTLPSNAIAAGAPGALSGVARMQNSPQIAHVPQAPAGAPPANRFNRQRPSSRTLVVGDLPSPASSWHEEERPPDSAARTPSPPLESFGVIRYLTNTVDLLPMMSRHPAPMPGSGAAAVAAMEDEDADDMLLEWSRRIDFDAYMETWKRTATSDGSEGALPISTVAHTRALAPAVH